MNNSVLISIQPKWCELIANGKKTIEVRKTKPKLETPFKCYLYCTRQGRPLVYGSPCPSYVEENLVQTYGYSKEKAEEIFGCWNGKVIGEFVCDDLFTIGANAYGHEYIERVSCLSHKELENYQGEKTYIWGWHISDLKIYDEPKELKRFGKFECEYCGSKKECFAPETIYDCSLQRIDTHLNNNNMYRCDGDFLSLKRPPQSWCYVEELEG